MIKIIIVSDGKKISSKYEDENVRAGEVHSCVYELEKLKQKLLDIEFELHFEMKTKEEE